MQETTTSLTVPVTHVLSSRLNRQNEDSQQFYYEYIMTPPHEGFLAWISRTLIRLFKFIFLCCISAASYGIFYSFMMPKQIANKELHFDYFYEQPFHVKQQMNDRGISLFRHHRGRMHDNYDESQTPVLPTATIDLTARHNEWEAHLEEVLPHPKHSRLLQSYQEYYVEMILFMPETETNKAAGMFGIEMELWSDMKVATSRKSYRFPHQTDWIRQLSKLITVGPLLLGAMEETRTVAGFVFRRFIESEQHPLRHIVVRLLQPGTSKVEIIGGEVHIGEELSIFQELLKTWFWACYCIGTSGFALWYVMVQNVALYYWNRFFDDEPPCDLDPNDDFQYDSFDDMDFGAEEEEFVDAVEDESPSNESAEEDEVLPEVRRRGSVVMEEGEDENDWEDLDIPLASASSDVLGRFPASSREVYTVNCNPDDDLPRRSSTTTAGSSSPQAVSPRVSFHPVEPQPKRRANAPTVTTVFEGRRDRARNHPSIQRRELRREMTDEELQESLFGQVPESTLQHVRERLGNNEQGRGWFFFF